MTEPQKPKKLSIQLKPKRAEKPKPKPQETQQSRLERLRDAIGEDNIANKSEGCDCGG